MNRRFTAFVLGLLLICSMFIPISLGGYVKNIPYQPVSNNRVNWLYVGGSGPDNYTRIQDAIDNASYGDTIFVYNGTYNENLVLGNSIFLIGEDKNTTIIDGQLKGDVVEIIDDNVHLSGFTIKNSGNIFYPPDCDAGIDINSDNNTIKNNIIKTNHNSAIYSYSSYNNIISNNYIVENEACGIHLFFIGNSIIVNNLIQNNEDAGIYLGPNNFNNNRIYANIIKDNEFGIILSSCENNTIKKNNIEDNSEEGICLIDAEHNKIVCNTVKDNKKGILLYCNSSNNCIYWNNFLNNTINAYDYCNNIWDNGYPFGGNFWDDYNGEDKNGDGIGDTPYPIPDGGSEDKYPLMEPWVNIPPIFVDIDGPQNGKPKTEYDFCFKAFDPNGDNIYVKWIWGDGNFSNWIGPFKSGIQICESHIWKDRGKYFIEIKIKDDYDAINNATLKIVIPRNNNYIIKNLMNLIDIFPLLQGLFHQFH